MGFKDVINRVRSVFTREKHAVEQAVELSKGMNQPQGGDFSSLYGRYGMEPLLDYLRIEQELVSRFMDYNEMESSPELSAALDIWADEACITGETEIPLLDGTTKTVKELYDNSVKNAWIYTSNPETKEVTAGQFSHVQKIAEKVAVYRVVYEERNGRRGSIRVTADHKFLLTNGSYCRAGDLKPGNSLMALFRMRFKDPQRKQVYENVLVHPFKRVWQSTHRMVMKAVGAEIKPGELVHHEDHDGLNNVPGNLAAKSFDEHMKIHDLRGEKNPRFRADVLFEHLLTSLSTGYLSKKAVQKMLGCGFRVVDRLIHSAGYKNWAALKAELFGLDRRSRGHASKPEYIEKANQFVAALLPMLKENPRLSLSNAHKRLGVSQSEVEEALARLGYPRWNEFKKAYGLLGSAPLVENHKVVEVVPAGLDDVYDLVDSKPHHNFAAGTNGEFVFVKNTQPDVLTGRTVWIESDDVGIKKLLQSLLDQTLQLDEDIWSIARNLCKYGNNYEELLVTQEGVVGLNPLPVETVRRFEREKGLLIGFAQDPSGRFGIVAEDVDKALRGDSAPPPNIAVFETWQMAHFRLMGRSRPSTYGISILEPARWLWRRLLLLEDAALIYRLTRTPTRWIFYIDVGKLPPSQALGQIRKIKQEFTKNKFVNERGGVDLRYSPLASDENLFIPVVDGKRTTEVDLMATPEWQVMDDINYFKDKLFSAIKIPKAYLSEESDQRSRVLSLLDIRFARGVMRVQRELKTGIRKICKVHLAAIGIDPEKVSFDVFLTVPSWAYELAQIEVRNAKAEFADKVSAYLPERAIIKLIFGFSDEEIDALRKEKDEEAGGGGMEEPGAGEPGAEEPKKKPDQRKTGGSPIDLPGAARVAGRETEAKAYKVLVEHMEKLTKSNSKLAKKFEELKDFSHELRSSMFFKGSHGSKTRAVPSFGNGGGRANPE